MMRMITIRTLCSNLAGRVASAGTVVHCLLILAIGIAIYANTFNVPFLLDGVPCIAENPAIGTYFDASIPDEQRYVGVEPDIINSMHLRPLAYLTFALNYRVHGLNVAGYHYVNLVIHLAAALVVYALVGALLATPFLSDQRENTSTGKLLPLIIALLFVCHPIQTAAVTYIVQRFASLATLLSLLSLLMYLHARVSGQGNVRAATFIAGSTLFSILGMYTKESVFTLPVLIVICEVLFLKGAWGTRVKFLAPLICTMLIVPLNMISLTGASNGVNETLQNTTNLSNLTNVSRWDFFCTQNRVMLTYLRLLILPINQHLDYDYPRYHSLLAPPVLASALFLTGIVACGIRAGIRSRLNTPGSWPLRLFAFGVAWFFITIAPSSSIIPLDDMIFEYHLYLPSFGFFLAVTAIAILTLQKLDARRITTHVWPLAGVALTVLALSLATISRNYVCGTAVRFWEDNVAKAPGKSRPHHNLGSAYRDEFRFSDAIEQNMQAITLEPDRPFNYLSWNNIAICLTNLKRENEAMAAYEEALKLRPAEYQMRIRYAMLLTKAGRISESREQRRIARELQQ